MKRFKKKEMGNI